MKEECGASDGREQRIRKQAFDWRQTRSEWCHYQACRGHPIDRAFVQTLASASLEKPSGAQERPEITWIWLKPGVVLTILRAATEKPVELEPV